MPDQTTAQPSPLMEALLQHQTAADGIAYLTRRRLATAALRMLCVEAGVKPARSHADTIRRLAEKTIGVRNKYRYLREG